MIEFNTEAHPQYTRPQLGEWMGLIGVWFSEWQYSHLDYGDNMVQYMQDSYGFGQLYRMVGKVSDSGTYVSSYEEDEDLDWIGRIMTAKGYAYCFPYGIVAIPTDDGHFITRMD
jgi:hypothetical protein